MAKNRHNNLKHSSVNSPAKLLFMQSEWLNHCAEVEEIEHIVPQTLGEHTSPLVAMTHQEERERLEPLDASSREECEPAPSTLPVLSGVSDGSEKIRLDTSRSEQNSPYEPELGPLPAVYLSFVLRCLRESEHGDAQIFAYLFRDRCVYDPSARQWHLWLEHYWQEDWRDYPRILVSGPLASIYQKASTMMEQPLYTMGIEQPLYTMGMEPPLYEDSSESEQKRQKSVTVAHQAKFAEQEKPVPKQRDQSEQREHDEALNQQDRDTPTESSDQLALDESIEQEDHSEQLERDQDEQDDQPEQESASGEQVSDAVSEMQNWQKRAHRERLKRSSMAVKESKRELLREGQQGILSKDQQDMLKELGQRVAQLKTLARVQNVLVYAKTLLAVEPKVWDANPWLLGTKQGVIDLRTGTLRPGRPDDYIRTIIPTEWKGLDEPAPRFQQFLREIFADRAEDERDELSAFLQRALGYGLTGNVNEHIFLMLYGEEGRNGKDTLMRVLEHVLGSAVGAISQDVLIAGARFSTPGNAKPHLCSLQGKRIAWASEPDEHARFAVNQIKLLTGGGDIVARQLYGREFAFQPSHLLILLSNHKPEANAADRAFWERLCPIVFNQRFVTHPKRANEQLRDPRLVHDLEAEASGILAWLVRGTLDWHRIGLAIPESVRRARQEYRSGESTIESFIADCCALDPEAQTTAGVLYKAYHTWANENGLTPVSNKQFGLEMKGIDGVSSQRTKIARIYQGITLQHAEEF